MGRVAYTIADAAAATATSEAIITTEIREGRLVSRIAGTTRVILHTDLLDWAERLPIVSPQQVETAKRHLSVAT